MVRPAYPLRTERLVLRPFADPDLDALHGLHSRPDVVRYLYWDPISRDDARRMLKRRMKSTQIEKEGDAIQLAMVLPESGTLIGHVNLQLISQTNRLGCDARNTASARLMERLGMRREAQLRENEFVKGEWTDELIYAMLAGEWQARTPQ